MPKVVKNKVKIKSKSSAKKRFKLTSSGKVKFFSAYLSHNTSKRSPKMKRTNRGSQILAKGDAKLVKKYMLK